jgi:hypothetical protein
MTKAIEEQSTALAQRFEAIKGVQLVEIKDGLVIYEHEPRRVHRLNRSAAVIYILCDGSRVIDEIVDEVQIAFDMATRPDHAVAACLRQLVEAGVIRPVDGQADVVENQSATTTPTPTGAAGRGHSGE